MISAEVQRTLVKSPPELWAELSDEDALARHLVALGAIKITTTKPEQTVEWEAEAAHGKVELKPSGWGTKVTLSITREAPRASASDAQELEPAAAAGPGQEPEREPAIEPEPQAIANADPDADVEAASETRQVVEQVAREPTPRRGFFARLFRRRSAQPTTVQEPEAVHGLDAVQGPEASEQPAVEPQPQPVTEQQPASADLATELAVAEEEIVQQTTELLNGVLDRLGAAHHRPFSRA